MYEKFVSTKICCTKVVQIQNILYNYLRLVTIKKKRLHRSIIVVEFWVLQFIYLQYRFEIL